MDELTHYPSFVSFSDDKGNSREDLVRDTNNRSIKFETPTLRPGDKIQMRVKASDPKGRKMEISFRRGIMGRKGEPPAQVVSDGEEAVFDWTITAKEVGQGRTFSIYLRTLGTEYHRMNVSDQILSIDYAVDPPEGY